MNLFHGYYLHPVTNLTNVLEPSQQLEISEDQASLQNYNILKDLEISVAPATKKLMKGFRMVFRPDPKGFSIYIQAQKTNEGLSKPFIPFDTGFKLTFFLRLKNPVFLNFTDLAPEDIKSQSYYFSNLISNQVQAGNTSTLYLNQPDEVYASEKDHISLITSQHIEDVAHLGLNEVRFKLTNPLFTFEQVCLKAEEEDKLQQCKLDLDTLPSGKYTLTTSSSSGEEKDRKEVFLGNEVNLLANVGIIDIFHLPNDPPSPYTLLNVEGELQNPTYTLWWKNRKTKWRYLFNRLQADASEECDVELEGGQNTGKTLVTKEILPLTHRYRSICYQMDNPGTTNINETILLPNPEPDRIYLDEESTINFSEIQMGDVDLTKVV